MTKSTITGTLLFLTTIVLSLQIFGVEIRLIPAHRFALGTACLFFGCTTGAFIVLWSHWKRFRKHEELAQHARTVESAGHLSKLLMSIEDPEKQQTILSSLPGLLFDETREALAILRGDIEGPRDAPRPTTMPFPRA